VEDSAENPQLMRLLDEQYTRTPFSTWLRRSISQIIRPKASEQVRQRAAACEEHSALS
jgi:hypothetical protein